MSPANEDKTNVVETWIDTDAPFAQSSATFPLSWKILAVCPRFIAPKGLPVNMRGACEDFGFDRFQREFGGLRCLYMPSE